MTRSKSITNGALFVSSDLISVETSLNLENTKFKEPGELNGEYDVIYADPPYRYDFSSSSKRAIENHYPTMSLEDIKKLKIPAAPNSVLLMWVPAPKLTEGLEVLLTKLIWCGTKPELVWDIGRVASTSSY